MRRRRLLAALAGMAMLSLGAGVARAAEQPTPAIVVDQFGYLPDQPKVAVLRDPVRGFDDGGDYAPGPRLEVVDAGSGEVVLTGAPAAWSGGRVDPSSGDRAWWFDFSALARPGTYRIVDPARGVRSAPFRIAPDVYRPVLVQAVRMLFYQRAGYPKAARYAGAKWADRASHLQDEHARLYSAPNDASTERDLHGGWYDAGDYNRYTAWAANDVVELLHAYVEAPGIWTDDYGIPESGDGVPDLLNEVKWEVDWLTRMQNPDGAMLSVLGVSHASPPSAAKGPSFYGPPNTIAALTAAGGFAYAAKVYGADPRFAAYAHDLAARAVRAWDWAQAHPHLIFRNNDAGQGSIGLAAGQQETDDAGRAEAALTSAAYLFQLTGDGRYRDYVDAHLGDMRLENFNLATALLDYARTPGATPRAAAVIRAAYVAAVEGLEEKAARTRRDPYRAFLPAYVWGSNMRKGDRGVRLLQLAAIGGGASSPGQDAAAAEDYIHYLHGVNPLGKVYLSNMGAFGATNSVDRFYHSWFAEGTRWASVSASPDGPPPGYLVGGPDPEYSWDPRCPWVSPRCGTAMPAPPHDQPPQKAYKDFGTAWPLNSWQITEPDVGYQAAYIRLLARFVR